MKFLRWGPPGHEKPGVIESSGIIRDLSSIVDDITPETIGSGTVDSLSDVNLATLDVVAPGSRIGPCLKYVSNFYCIGLNYHKEDAPSEMSGSNKVVITSKASSALSGPYDDIVLPSDSTKTDWEVELGIVIGKECIDVPVDQVMDHVFGYTIVNDLSERDYMFEHGGQWIKGKSVPGYGPIGPWLVTKDEIEDPQDLSIWLRRNGEIMQDANTAQMISGVIKLVSHMSHYMKLLPGDLIATGTPPGIGMHRTPPVFLEDGDRLELGIKGLGVQSGIVRRAEM